MKKKLGYNKKQFAEVCNVSEVTVIKGYKLLEKFDEYINKHLSF
jgi:hypothetical protein